MKFSKGTSSHWEQFLSTLFAYIVQFVMSSESIPPSKPKSAPEAPTEILDWIKSDDNILPPKPDTTYSNPILTVGPDQN